MEFEKEKLTKRETVFERMPAERFLAELEAKIKERPDVVFERRGMIKYQLPEGEKIYDFARIVSKEIKPDDKILFIRAGLHGEEIAGPMTMQRHINKIIDYAHQKGLKVIIYPLANPSGFESGKRFNVSDELGDEGTDDIIRYETADKKIVSELEKDQPFRQWFLSDSPRIRAKLPQEAALMLKELKDLPIQQIIAAIDFHQDYITPDASAAAYHYNHNGGIESSVYQKIIEAIEKELPILKNADISAGYETPMRSDKLGFITRHDGSLPDAMYRMGVKHCIAVETTGVTLLETADKVNMLWIKGIIDIVQEK